jgi:7-cyano-7-deazaguanine synthase in queuosine biosynthesis
VLAVLTVKYQKEKLMLQKINDPVSIVVSGGADSAILLYLLLRNQESTVHITTLTNKQKFYRNAVPASNVVKFCVNATGNNNITHKFLYEDYQNDKSFTKMIESMETKIKIMGLTDLPPKDSQLDIPVLPKNDIRNNPSPRNLWKGDMYFPFANMNKKDIAKIYIKNDLLDTLFPLTTSCESLDDITGHCGLCWWCKERLWAFGRLV